MPETTAKVTKYLDDYFSRRPQLVRPERGRFGYIVPHGIVCALHSLVRDNAEAGRTEPARFGQESGCEEKG